MVETAQAPNKIGRYELLTRLATGGMAELFLAREQGLAGLERLVVVKRILPHLADQPSFVEMFLREARIVARLSHPNVVQIYELGQESDTYHIAMEYIHGSTVRELLLLAQEKEQSAPLEVIVSIAEQACRGLHAAHELRDLDGRSLGLVHRDISPHNLMCTTEGHIKLLDFGVAKSTTAGVEATYSGNLKGKFAYLSPEQCLHEPLDRRSDVFAMGIVLWEMVTMRRLFKRRTELEMMQAVIGGDVPAPSQFRPEVPPGIDAVILKALATDRDERYATAEKMREALAKAAGEAGLSFGEDKVAAFIEDVAGERLAERREAVASAFERALTASERRRLLHMTGSNSRSQSVAGDLGDDVATVVDRPGAHDEFVDTTRMTPSERIARLTDFDRQRGVDETTHRAQAHEESQRPRGRKRRIALVALVTIIIGSLTAFAFTRMGDEDSELAPIVTSGEPLAIGWAPTVDPEVLREEIEPLHRYLEKTTGRPVPLVLTEDYGELAEQLLSGEVAFAAMPPLLFVKTLMREPTIEILALKEFDGSISSDALLLVRMDSEIRRLSDLEGRTFCFVDPMSTSGHFLPREHIRDSGFDPDEFVGEIHWSGDHFQGMRDLIDGRCDAAAAYSGAFLSGDEFGIRTGQIRQLAVTGHIPQDTITAGAQVSAEDRLLIKEALLRFDPLVEFGVPRLGRNQRITGFQAGKTSAFKQLREIVESGAVDVEGL